MSKVDNIKRREDRVISLMLSLSRNIGTTISVNGIRKDMIQNDEPESFHSDTVSSYIEALRKLYIVEDLNAWNSNLRSSTAIRSKPTRYLVDPFIATAALSISPSDLMNDLTTAGFLFESMCIRDLRIYAESLKGKVYHFRDNKGFEVDAIVHLNNGEYGLIEIKLFNQERIEEGAKNLLKLSSLINTEVMKKPSFLMVLT